MRGREWERDPQSKSRGLTGAKGGWWVRADQGNGEITGRHCAPGAQARHVVTCWKAEAWQGPRECGPCEGVGCEWA